MSEPIVSVRLDTPADIDGIRRVHLDAFGRYLEANLVDALRRRGQIVISLVAEAQQGIVGSAILSPVSVTSTVHGLRMLGLGPVAVLTSFRSNGIDTMLIERGIDLARVQGWPAIVVFGSPEYYERFGFVPASRFGLTCEFRAPASSFMVLELLRGTLKGWGEGGVVRYEPEFSRI